MIKRISISIFNKIEQLINRGRFVFRKVSEPKKVKHLVESLHPYHTNFELIRLGGEGDGGYLVPDDMENIEACFSPGVFMVSEFELDCLKRGMKVFMADKSVEKPNLDIPESQYSFIKKFIGPTNNKDFITMEKWVEESGVDSGSDLILQMDIEGAEYATFLNMSDDLVKRFRIMVVEFHGLQDIWQPRFLNFAELVFSKILQTHTCVHIHPNNGDGIETRLNVNIPKTAEFTFLRNDRITKKTFAQQFPHPLDRDNTKDQTMMLPRDWYR